MHKCERCGEKATLYATKRFGLFSIRRRYYCDSCFTKVDKRQDKILIITLIFSVFLMVFFLYLLFVPPDRFFQSEKQLTETARRLEKDFDRDGVLDLWEIQAREKQIRNFKLFGYPWESAYGGKEPTRASLASLPVKEWLELFENNNEVKNAFNFSSVMEDVQKKYTDPDSPRQLDRVFLTMNRDIAFIVKTYSLPPSKWATLSPTPPSENGKTAKKKDAGAPAPPVIEAFVFYEKLKKSEGLELARLFGVPPKKLPVSYTRIK